MQTSIPYIGLLTDKAVQPKSTKIYRVVNFIYSEKATKFCEMFTLLLSYVVPVKSKAKISQNFLAFSEYMNFNRKNSFVNSVGKTEVPLSKTRYVVCTVKSRAVDQSTIQFSTIFGVLQTETCYYSLVLFVRLLCFLQHQVIDLFCQIGYIRGARKEPFCAFIMHFHK